MIIPAAKTYSKGQMFLREFPSGANELYILAVTGIDGDGDAQMNLIHLKDGDRWTHPVAVNNCTAVTELEMEKIFRGQVFRPVEVKQIETTMELVATRTVTVTL